MTPSREPRLFSVAILVISIVLMVVLTCSSDAVARTGNACHRRNPTAATVLSINVGGSHEAFALVGARLRSRVRSSR
jgi:hypothetical protein